MKKLLNRSLRPLIIYALLIIIISIPVYFFIINKIWISEMDEHHRVSKQKIEKQLNNLHFSDEKLKETIAMWNQLQHGIHIESVKVEAKSDQFYTISRFDEYHNENEQFRGLKSQILVNNKPYLVTIESNMEEVDETIMAVGLVATIFFFILMFGFIILNRRLSSSLWKPFYKTMNQLKEFDLNKNSSIELEKTNIAEFNELNGTVKKLVDRNVSSFLQQKEFNENASHELQTPLAIIKSKLDLLLQDESLSKEQTELIDSINIALSRTSRINKNILLLAKIENQQYDLTESIDLSQSINQNLELLSDHVENKSILIEKNIEVNTIIKCNKSLLDILITNLLLNAIRHSQPNSLVKIELTKHTFVIKNVGSSSLNTDHLFKRFISASSETPNSGLGLSIVKQICELLNWEINYRFENNFHVFSIRFQ